MATTADTTPTDTTTTEGWFAEVEYRRYLRKNRPEDTDHIRPTKPNLERTEYYDPDESYLASHMFKPDKYNFDVENHPDDYLVKIHDDKIIIPVETTSKISYDNLMKIIQRIMDNLPVYQVYDESENTDVYVSNGPHIKKGKDGEPIHRPDQYDRFKYRRHDPDPRPIYVQVPPDHRLCKLQNIVDKRRSQNRDLKVLITARDGETGTGKTTLAVQLAKSWDLNGWNASKATLDGDEYIQAYTDLEPGSVLIGDELEGMADPRRSMSKQNVTLSQFWATMRQWEVSTICTFPSMRMVDVRLLELADIRINVIQRGVAVVNRIKIGDYDGEVSEVPIHRLRWDPLDDDRDYQLLTDKKTDRMENHAERLYHLASDDDENEDEPDPDEIRLETRNEVIQQIYNQNDITQQEIADAIGLDRSTISKIVN